MNAIAFYRIANWLWRRRVPLLPRILQRLIFLIYNSNIPATCTIGAGSRFAYGAIGVVLHSDCTIGAGVVIGPGVTLGGDFNNSGVPEIGNNVYIAGGAKILGGVKVGSGVIVGANAVVRRDVPENCIVAGIPARVIRELRPGQLNALEQRIAE